MLATEGLCLYFYKDIYLSVRLDIFECWNYKPKSRISARKMWKGLISDVYKVVDDLQEFLGSSKTYKIGFVAIYPQEAGPDFCGAYA